MSDSLPSFQASQWSAALAYLCLEASLYQQIPVEEDERADLVIRMRLAAAQFDAHCTGCGKESTFKKTSTASVIPSADAAQVATNMAPTTVYFRCQRAQHRYAFTFMQSPAGVMKIGQFPSLEDIASADIDRYRKVLDREHFANLKRAGGLRSHGIGIGAFVYLRRIFERLIAQHKAEFEAENGPIEDWNSLRMPERIEALRSVLPALLVEHRASYSILSLGVHELSEKECLGYYPAVHQAIVMILEQDLYDREKKTAEEKLRKDLTAIKGEISDRAAAKSATAGGDPNAAAPPPGGRPS